MRMSEAAQFRESGEALPRSLPMTQSPITSIGQWEFGTCRILVPNCRRSLIIVWTGSATRLTPLVRHQERLGVSVDKI